jgi:UDP-N-acetylglucosamine 4,6-dehydratase
MVIGIRPGEKLHEAMITEDDARQTLEYDTYFVIQPEFPWWSKENQNEGKALIDGFKYTSDLNDEWLTVEQLRDLVESV